MTYHPPSRTDFATIHPQSQAVRLVTEWLTRQPMGEAELLQVAADRGVSEARMRGALSTMRTRGQLEVDRQTDCRQPTYRLVPTMKRGEPC